MRRLATIQKIEKLEPIDGADSIEVASVLGWKVVVKKGEFEEGDKCVYIEIDSIVPSDNEVFAFLEPRKYRVRTIKLRKQVSQGLCLPVALFPTIAKKKIDTEVTAELKIEKYDPEAQAEKAMFSKKKQSPVVKYMLKYQWFRKVYTAMNDTTKGFPSDIVSKTDEERVQNSTNLLRNNVGTLVSYTEKLDGQSYTATLRKKKFALPFTSKYEFVVASRNLRIGQSQTNTSYMDVTKKYNIRKVLEDNIGTANSMAIQGEICGPGIQKNKYDLTENKLFIFNVKRNYGTEVLNLTQADVETFANDNELLSVPVLGTFVLDNDVQALVAKAGEDTSKIKKGLKREGIVIREAANHHDGFSFKAINPEFLLKYDE